MGFQLSKFPFLGQLSSILGFNRGNISVEYLINVSSHLSVKDFINAPPNVNDLTSGDLFLIKPPAQGDWNGYDNYITEYKGNNVQKFYPPKDGLTVFVENEERLYIYDAQSDKQNPFGSYLVRDNTVSYYTLQSSQRIVNEIIVRIQNHDIDPNAHPDIRNSINNLNTLIQNHLSDFTAHLNVFNSHINDFLNLQSRFDNHLLDFTNLANFVNSFQNNYQIHLQNYNQFVSSYNSHLSDFTSHLNSFYLHLQDFTNLQNIVNSHIQIQVDFYNNQQSGHLNDFINLQNNFNSHIQTQANFYNNEQLIHLLDYTTHINNFELHLSDYTILENFVYSLYSDFTNHLNNYNIHIQNFNQHLSDFTSHIQDYNIHISEWLNFYTLEQLPHISSFTSHLSDFTAHVNSFNSHLQDYTNFVDGVISGSITVGNADRVDQIHASTTPTPNTLLALDALAEQPEDTIKLRKDTVFYVVSNINPDNSFPQTIIYPPGTLQQDTSRNSLYRKLHNGNQRAVNNWQDLVLKDIDSLDGNIRINANIVEARIGTTGSQAQVYPLVGAKHFIIMNVNNNNPQNFIYQLPRGCEATIEAQVNHIPIVFFYSSRSMFEINWVIRPDASDYIGLRPSNLSVSRGYAQGMYITYTGGTSINRRLNTSYIPITRTINNMRATYTTIIACEGTNRYFRFHTIGTRLQTSGFGRGSQNAYWLGTLYMINSGTPLSARLVERINIKRLA